MHKCAIFPYNRNSKKGKVGFVRGVNKYAIYFIFAIAFLKYLVLGKKSMECCPAGGMTEL